MEKQNLFLVVGLTWTACFIYQYKNENIFMAAASAVIALVCFALAVYKRFKSKDSKNNESDKTGV